MQITAPLKEGRLHLRLELPEHASTRTQLSRGEADLSRVSSSTCTVDFGLEQVSLALQAGEKVGHRAEALPNVSFHGCVDHLIGVASRPRACRMRWTRRGGWWRLSAAASRLVASVSTTRMRQMQRAVHHFVSLVVVLDWRHVLRKELDDLDVLPSSEAAHARQRECWVRRR